MTNPSDVIFHWRESGPNLWMGVVVTIAVVALGYLACRITKSRVAGIVLFGAWAVYVPFVFIGSRIWPEEVSISMKKIQGRHNISRFSIEASEMRSVQGSRTGKGGYSLHVFLRSGNKAVGIPVIWDQNKGAYKNALHQVCPNADLDW